MSTKKKKKSKKGTGLQKEMKCSKELRAVTKTKYIARGALIGLLWKYIKKHKLQSKESGQIVRCDDKLSAIFKRVIRKKRKIVNRGKKIRIPAGSIFMTEMVGALGKHLS